MASRNSAYARKVEEEVRRYFRDAVGASAFEFETVISGGMAGVTFRFLERPGAGGTMTRARAAAAAATPPRRYVGKRLFGGLGVLRREMGWLEQLQWSAHIVNLGALDSDPWVGQPYMVLEFLPYGTLDSFVQEMGRIGQYIPNRVFWSFFLCLARACAAMAYPPVEPNWAVTNDLRLETPLQGIQPQALAHGDMHTRNIMLGDFDVTRAEHQFVPMIKLIDFDQARILTDPEEVDEDDVENYDDVHNLQDYRSPEGDRNPGIDHNILAAGRVMANVLKPGDRLMQLDECRDAVQDADVRPDLDEDLRVLVARCLAAEPLNRPALGELVAACHAAVYTKDSDFYAEEKEGQFETDGYLLFIMQRYLHDADTTQLAGHRNHSRFLGAFAVQRNTSKGKSTCANGWIIQKFGGTSVGKFPDNIAEDIVRASLALNKIVVVCSARSSGRKATGTTSRLLEVYKKLRSISAATSDEYTQNALLNEAKGLVFDICNEHVYAAQSFIKNSNIQMKVSKDIEDDCQELIDYVIAAKRFNLEVNARSKDRVVSFGEKLSCRFMAAMLKDRHVEAEYVDLSDVMHYDSSDRLTPAFYRDAAAIFRKRVLACEDRVPVVTGFFGTVPGSLMDGDVGRGYTDLCAALIAVGLGAEELQVWKEVDGIFTADPTKVPTARLLAAITPSEAAELTFYGSEVIHHLTMDQVIKAEPPIPIRIKNVKNPRGNGTIVVPDPVQSPARQIKRSPPSYPSLRKTPKRPTAVTIKNNIAVINVHSNKRSISHGFFAKVFSILNSHQISVDLISTSEVHVSMAIHAAGASASHFEQATRELEECGDVSILRDMAILSLVGAEMKNMIGWVRRVFFSLMPT
ncbi:hypothetical protein DL769_010903 [Monosporascus sp. CRB-8-3]|nr:hypothetical protein DL769_010903 [Monosporascus sp. CRB-8-3]